MSIKAISKSLATFILILGTIGSFVVAYSQGFEVNYRTFQVERNMVMTITTFLTSFLSVLVLSVVLYAISELLETQEKIYASLQPKELQKDNKPLCLPHTVPFPKSKSESINPALSTEREKEVVTSAELKSYGSWKCPECKRVNSGETCACGAPKPESV